jgi:hypothetical protein
MMAAVERGLIYAVGKMSRADIKSKKQTWQKVYKELTLIVGSLSVKFGVERAGSRVSGRR